MSKVGKNIRIVLVLLAGLIILLHSTIPHHHYLDSSCDHNFSNSNANETRGESSNEANTHCHALNNLVVEKVRPVTFSTINTTPSFLLFCISIFDTLKFDNKVLLTTYPTKDIIVLKQYLSSELSFRGPPALA
jgi:hypothetical protein